MKHALCRMIEWAGLAAFAMAACAALAVTARVAYAGPSPPAAVDCSYDGGNCSCYKRMTDLAENWTCRQQRTTATNCNEQSDCVEDMDGDRGCVVVVPDPPGGPVN